MRWLSRLLSPLSRASAPERAAQALTAHFAGGETLRASLGPVLEVLVGEAFARAHRLHPGSLLSGAIAEVLSATAM